MNLLSQATTVWSVCKEYKKDTERNIIFETLIYKVSENRHFSGHLSLPHNQQFFVATRVMAGQVFNYST